MIKQYNYMLYSNITTTISCHTKTISTINALTVTVFPVSTWMAASLFSFRA